MKHQSPERAPGVTYERRVPLMIKARPATRDALRSIAERDGKTMSFYISNILDRHVAAQAKKAKALA